MLMTIGEAFAEFKKENKDILIEKSKFYELRPEHVLLVSQMPHNVCVCKYHANFDFLIQSLSSTIEEFPCTGRNLLSLLCCNVHSEKCMTGICTDCHKETDMLIANDDVDKCLIYKQWKEIDGFLKAIEISSSVKDAVKELNNQLPYYKVHCFIKTIQSSYFEEAKNSVSYNEAILQIDFAENYTAVPQDEIQSAHWSHQQITIFTSCAWLYGNITHPIVVISDELNHDKFSVWVFLKTIIDNLKKEFPGLEKVKIFSDGSAAQFKNKFTISNLCYFENDFGITGEWNFFATSHGKGAVDGIGGMVKAKVWTVVKSRKVVVHSSDDFFQCVRNHVNGVKSFLISSDEVHKHKSILTTRWEKCASITGIQTKHHFEIYDSSHLLMGRTSKSTLEKIKVVNSNEEKVINAEVVATTEIEKLVVGDFVVVSLAVAGSSKKSLGTKQYHATVLAIDKNENITLKYMHVSGPYWYWPEKDDISCENISVVTKKVSPPSLVNNRGYYYVFQNP